MNERDTIDGAMSAAVAGFLCLLWGIRDARAERVLTTPEANLGLGVFMFGMGLFLSGSMLLFVANRRQK